MSKKGVSFEEKRDRLQSLFFEKQEVFTLKELETLGSKEKGIVMNSIKDVLKSLVDDNMVETDKIGSGNFFWSLPSKAGQVRGAKLKQLEQDMEETKQAMIDGKKRKQEGIEGRKPSEERTKKLARLDEMKTKKAHLEKELAKVAENDPEFLEKLKKEADVAKEAVNRWTDNIQALQQYVQTNFNVEIEAFNTQFGIPQDLDYVE